MYYTGEETERIFLEVKTSLIPEAGQGVFAKEDLPISTILCEYRGLIVEYDPKLPAELIDTVCDIPGVQQKVIAGTNIAAKINDCIDITKDGKMLHPGTDHNAAFHNCYKKVFVISTRPIKKGEEIYVSYGEEYWKPRLLINNSAWQTDPLVAPVFGIHRWEIPNQSTSP